MKRIYLLFILIFYATTLQAQPIISNISTHEINIDAKFNGAKILLFGAKDESGNVVITVRGPKRNFLVTKKEKLFGVWYNGQRVEFKNAFSYYSIFSTFEDDRTTNYLLSQLEIGASNLKFETAEDSNIDKNKKTEFTLQLIDKLDKDELYSIGSNKIDFLDETLFKVNLNFPKNIARGVYTVEIYLIHEDNLESFQSIPIYVNQIGFGAKIFDYAHQQPLLYGLFSVIIALVIGWIANFLFTRFIGK